MADLIENLSTQRVGQLTGSRDPQGRLLMNVTSPWTVEGVDLGANTEHNGRLYFFFGDVATTENGEHRWDGWNFFLPNDRQGATEAAGQPDWRFCSRCRSLFWAPKGDTAGTVCPRGGEHYFHPDSWMFFLPNDHQGATAATGQGDWRFCSRCHGLCWAPGGDPTGTTCPAEGQHSIHPDSWNFFLPNDHQGATAATGQGDWRFCRKCRSLAWFPDGATVGSCCPAGNERNSDLVAWTEDAAVTPTVPIPHRDAGWNFVLPNDHQGATAATGQPDWRFCWKCYGLFWAPGGSTGGSACPTGGEHLFPGDSWMFSLPNDHQGATAATGQPDWRFCDRCHGLFWAPGGSVWDTVCPVNGGEHSFNPQSWSFFLPSREQGATDSAGQPDWRFCIQCKGLFWSGGGARGVCSVQRGGGIHLNPVMKAAGTEFDPLAADWPVGVTKSLEAPGGAFSHNGRAHVFVNISAERWSEHKRPGDPQLGTYLISKADPSQPGPYRTEFLWSPRIGACPSHDDLMESHQPLGYTFVIPHDLADEVPRQRGWRRCRNCLAMFHDDDGDGAGGLCWDTGGAHAADGFEYAIPLAPGPDGTQARWARCGGCETLFWNDDKEGRRGLCRAGGEHQPTDPELALPHRVEVDNPNRIGKWRFCVECAGLFWNGDFLVQPADDRCPKTGDRHVAAGFDFALSHGLSETAERQGGWRHCGRCAALFRSGPDGAPAGTCPHGGAHAPGIAPTGSPPPPDFVLAHGGSEDAHRQANWRLCGKCQGLFWAGHPTGGCCPVDKGAHQAVTGPQQPGLDFLLPHFSPGGDSHNEDNWRFCGRCFELVWAGPLDRFSGVAPTIVSTAEHRNFLPDTGSEQTLVLTAFGFAPTTGVRLAFVPLRAGTEPVLRETRYYAGKDAAGNARWTPDEEAALDLFAHDGYTSLSASWLPGPRRWLLLYSKAHDGNPNAFELNAVARLAETPLEWSDAPEIPVFEPSQAYGIYMHKPGWDNLDTRIPPVNDGHKGWAYGLHLLNRYTTWESASGVLDIYYLLSLSVPYQVQLMHSRLRITEA
jgi:hypothetical protein